MLVDHRCPVCHVASNGPCGVCWASLIPHYDQVPVSDLEWCRSAFRHDRAAGRLVTSIKYRNDRAVVGALADELAALVRPLMHDHRLNLLTWIPTTNSRRADRGFDHGALLARALARRVGLRARCLLRRGDAGHQTGLDRAGRLAGPTLALRRQMGVTVRVPERLLVVDDVITTGASMAAGAQVLRAAGAQWVGGVAVSHRV